MGVRVSSAPLRLTTLVDRDHGGRPTTPGGGARGIGARRGACAVGDGGVGDVGVYAVGVVERAAVCDALCASDECVDAERVEVFAGGDGVVAGAGVGVGEGDYAAGVVACVGDAGGVQRAGAGGVHVVVLQRGHGDGGVRAADADRVSGGGGVSEREELDRLMSKAQSPAQLKGVISQYRNLMGSQYDNLLAQRRAAGLSDSTLPKYNVTETPEAHPQDIEAINYAKLNPNDPRSKAILKANGL